MCSRPVGRMPLRTRLRLSGAFSAECGKLAGPRQVPEMHSQEWLCHGPGKNLRSPGNPSRDDLSYKTCSCRPKATPAHAKPACAGDPGKGRRYKNGKAESWRKDAAIGMHSQEWLCHVITGAHRVASMRGRVLRSSE